MALNWIRDVTLQLRDGYCVCDAHGQEIGVIRRGLVAFDDGFVHIIAQGFGEVQVVPAIALWRASYPATIRRVRRQRELA
jgi:hypothetical protein